MHHTVSSHMVWDLLQKVAICTLGMKPVDYVKEIA